MDNLEVGDEVKVIVKTKVGKKLKTFNLINTWIITRIIDENRVEVFYKPDLELNKKGKKDMSDVHKTISDKSCIFKI